MQFAHHTNYLLALVPAIRRLTEAGLVGSTVFTVTELHVRLLHDLGQDEALRDLVACDPSLPMTSSATTMAQRRSLHDAVRTAVDIHKPDALLCTTADVDMLPNAWNRFVPSFRHWPRRSAGIVHFGYPKGALSRTEDAKRLVYETAWKASRWRRLLFVNPLVYKDLLQRGHCAGGRYREIADPVPAPKRTGTEAARRALGLPEDGILIGCVGMMDQRRAIPEFLGAFFGARELFDRSVRVVLAGRIDADHRRAIDERHAREIAAGALILIDRALSDDELLSGYAALDLHSMLMVRRFNLSANVLKCVAAGKLFVCDRVGHAAMVATQFDAGIACDVHDPASIAAALADGLARLARGQRQGDASRRLIEYHAVDNFARVALAAALGDEVYDVLGAPFGWEHAYGSV